MNKYRIDLNIYYQHVRNLNNKISNIKIQVPNSLYDIFIFNETWLTEKIVTSELDFHEYKVFRFDRNPQTSTLSKGGGVLIAVRKTYTSKSLVLYNISIELLFVVIQLPKRTLIISSVNT